MENVAAIISAADKQFIAFFEKCIQLDIFGAANPESIAGRYIRRVIEIRLQAAIGTVLGDLAALGYDAEWLCLRAPDCGSAAPEEDGVVVPRHSKADTVIKPKGHSVPAPTASDHIERRSTSKEKLNPLTNKSVSLDRWVQLARLHARSMWAVDSTSQPATGSVETDAGGDGEIQ